MNAPPLSASSVNTRASSDAQPTTRPRAGRSWLFSISGICFVFGALVAMQLRATQQINAEASRKKQGDAAAGRLAATMRERAEKSENESKALKAKLDSLQVDLKNRGTLSKSQVAALGSQIKQLQTVAGLTPVQGPGVRVVLSDGVSVMPAGIESMAPYPTLVHDFDLQQIVNEMRSVKAEAIAIHGADGQSIRITGYTPIRCAGPPILINFQVVASPYTIEAIGEPRTLRSSLEMPGGIIDELKKSGVIGVKVTTVDNLKFPAATDGAPKMRVAKTGG